MKSMKTKFVLFPILACIVSAVALGQTVSVNYNRSQSFSQYHTYAWGSDNTNQIQNSILAQQAKSDIDSAMQGKGLQLVQESQNPDLILTASGGMKQQTSYQAWGMRGIGGGMGGITPQQNVVGTMIVDLYDAKDQVPGVARRCSRYAEQQWQQKLTDGIESRAEDVQTMASRITALRTPEGNRILRTPVREGTSC
jgi:Domain of unknown function (DUF4136)